MYLNSAVHAGVRELEFSSICCEVNQPVLQVECNIAGTEAVIAIACYMG